ncbi:MAG: aminoacyl-tRNA hydrolase [Cyanobacteria bacterium P01_A01_bin.3]
MAIELVVGLGNPGSKYKGTRHNCGFMAIACLAKRWQVGMKDTKRFQGRYGEGVGPVGKLRLLEPTTYMNLSGQSVRAAADWFKLDPSSVLVVYDDMDLPFGRLRLRLSGSAGGHNGMKSIIQHLGTQEFPRLRMGVGSPGGDRDVIGHVLGGFTPKEKPYLQEVIDTSADAIETCLKKDVQTAMNRFNPKVIGDLGE